MMQVVKQRSAQQLFTRPRKRTPIGRDSLKMNPRHVWQERFYDFNVWTEQKRIDKLRYTHRNQVKRGLANSPDQWPWAVPVLHVRRDGLVRVNETSVMKMQLRAPLSDDSVSRNYTIEPRIGGAVRSSAYFARARMNGTGCARSLRTLQGAGACNITNRRTS